MRMKQKSRTTPGNGPGDRQLANSVDRSAPRLENRERNLLARLMAAEMGASTRLVQGYVQAIIATGEILVALRTAPSDTIACERLETTDGMLLRLAPGDRVLVLLPRQGEELGCVLGRLGLVPEQAFMGPGSVPGSMIHTQGRLTIRCGEAVITLNEDGKILIEGVDIVSKAKGAQRIKGASVRIN